MCFRMLVEVPHITKSLRALFAEGWQVHILQVHGEGSQASESNLADVAGGFDVVAFVMQHQVCHFAEFLATFPTSPLSVRIIHLPFCG